MCKKNYQSVNPYCSPCGCCTDFLEVCKPVIINGFIYGECDLVACEFCDEECDERSY